MAQLTTKQQLVTHQLYKLIDDCDLTVSYFTDLASQELVKLTPSIMEHVIGARQHFEAAKKEFMEGIKP
jgi:hypothetical protein